MNCGKEMFTMLGNVGRMRRCYALIEVMCWWIFAMMVVRAALVLPGWVVNIGDVTLAGMLTGMLVHTAVIWRDRKYRLRASARYVEQQMGLTGNELINAVDLYEATGGGISNSLREMAVGRADQLSVGVNARELVDGKRAVWLTLLMTMAVAGVLLWASQVGKPGEQRASGEMSTEQRQDAADENQQRDGDIVGVMLLDGEITIEYRQGGEVIREQRELTGGDMVLPAGAIVELAVRCDQPLSEAQLVLRDGVQARSIALALNEGEKDVAAGAFELDMASSYSLMVTAASGDSHEVLLAGRMKIAGDSGESAAGDGQGDSTGEGRIAMGRRQKLPTQQAEVAQGRLVETADDQRARENEPAIVDYDALPLKYRQVVANYFRILAEENNE